MNTSFRKEPAEQHPAETILQNPLQGEALRNRRALLAVTFTCLAVRINGAFPQRISALGISFSGSHTHRLIWIAICFQIYLCMVFVLSAIPDWLLWRHALRQKPKDYSLNDAVEAAVDEAGPVPSSEGRPISRTVKDLKRRIRLEAPDTRTKSEMQAFANKMPGRDLIRMISKTHPWTLPYLGIMLLFPVLMFLISVLGLLLWTPSAG